LPPLRTLVWDVDGTLAETERDGHRVAFNRAFEEHGLRWRWDEVHYGSLLAVAGGRERLLHDMARRADAPVDPAQREQLARALHATKTRHYAAIVESGALRLRPGVRELLDEAAADGIVMAIATTTSRANVEALLGSQLGGGWHTRFAAVVCAEDAPLKKPDPQAYRMVLARLDCAAAEAQAIEDSPAGTAACRAAGVPVIVTRSAYFADAGPGKVLAAGPGLHTSAGWHPEPVPGAARIGLAQIARWRAHAATAAGA
jgi:HAD superfamily hydrolase (TIGR01509 family)